MSVDNLFGSAFTCGETEYLTGLPMKNKAQTKSMGLIILPGRKSSFSVPINWSILYVTSVALTVCLCLLFNFFFVLYPSRMSEYNLLVAGGTTHFSQVLEQQVAMTRAEIRRSEEYIQPMIDVSKVLEKRTGEIKQKLQLPPNALTFDDLNETIQSAGFAATIDPQNQVKSLGLQMKEIIDQADKTFNMVAEDARQSDNTLWFQNHTPNRWPIPDPYKFERPGKPGKRDLNPGFGNRINPISFMAEFHTGIDVDGDLGEPIYAVADGLVTMSRWHGGYGNIVEILHRHDSGGIRTRYAHNAENLVKEGDWVKRGQVIAYMGSTGYSTDPHIHFELLIDGEFWDAGQYIRNAINHGIKGDDLTVSKESDKDSSDENKSQDSNNKDSSNSKDLVNPTNTLKDSKNVGEKKQDVP